MSHLRAFVERSALRRENMAATEVISKIGGQPISDSRGLGDCRHLAHVMRTYPKQIKRDLGSKGGLTLRQLKDRDEDVFTLDDGQEVVAYARLDESPSDPNLKYLYNLFVRPDWRKRGLATVLHLGALHVFKHLESDSTLAMGSLKAFKALEKYGYKVKLRDIETGETLAFKWGPNDIPIARGKSIEEAENYVLYV